MCLQIGFVVFSFAVGAIAFFIHLQSLERNSPNHPPPPPPSPPPPKAEERSRGYDVFQAPKNKKPPKPVTFCIEKCEVCGICFNPMEREGEGISHLKCGHAYHDGCLAELIMYKHKCCPYCRRDIELYNPVNSVPTKKIQEGVASENFQG